MCDGVPDCDDVSDEDVCGPLRKDIDNSITLPPPALIQFDGRGARESTEQQRGQRVICVSGNSLPVSGQRLLLADLRSV